MGKDDINSTFDFDTNPEFNENFYKNIEKALSDDVDDKKQMINDDVKDLEASENKTSNPIDENSATEDNGTGENSEEGIEDELININASLARQICEELEINGTEGSLKRKKMPRWLKIQSGILIGLICLMCVGAFLGFTTPGKRLLAKIGGKIWASTTNTFEDTTVAAADTDYLDEDDLNSEAVEVDPSKIVWPSHPGEGRQEEGVYNILLLGEEAIGSGSARGRTDEIIIATLNTKEKKIKLTSLMRDTLVQIPGYQDNKLNSAYEKGGIDLLYETISLNFDIHLDGCVKVNFENFEKIIDQLGGLDLTLTAGEAKYLNTTNYISKPQYRTIVEGTQHLNGNQVLGYSRVRKRATITGQNNDYGRTDRHRIVLNAIFEKYKTKSKIELASLMIGILPMITTDIDSKCFELLLNTFIEMGTMKIEQLRIPADGTFTDNVKVRGMDVLIPDLGDNVVVLHKFIFGEDSTSTNGTDINSTTTGSN